MLSKIILFEENHFSHYFARIVRLCQNDSVLKRNDSQVMKNLFIKTKFFITFKFKIIKLLKLLNFFILKLLRHSMSSFTSETTGSKNVVQLETGGVVVLVHNGSLCKK